MCGRYGRRADKQRIAEWFRTHNTNVFNDSELAPTYNAAPQTFQPVIRLNAETGEREITMMKWGLVPYWSKTVNLKYSTINADADKLTTSGVWREPFRHRRCLVPADWFYEWVRPESRYDDCPAWPHDRTCRPIGSTLGGQAVW